MAQNYVITYPDTGTPQHNAVSGRWYIDFWKGEVFDKSDNKTILSRKLSDTGHEFIRSVAIFSSNAIKVNFGQGEGGATSWTPPNSWTILEDIEVKQLVLEVVEAVTPDESSLLIIGSTSPKRQFTPVTNRNSHTSDVDAIASTNAYVVMLKKYVPNYDYNTFVIQETGAVNGITYKIEAKIHSSENFVELQADTAVAASATDIVLIQGHYGWIQLSIKSTVGGSHGEFTGEWGGSG